MWEEAIEKYEYYVSEEKLSEFAGKAFDSKNRPSSEFLAHCRKAIASKNKAILDNDQSANVVELDDGEISLKCYLFNFENPLDLNYSVLSAAISGFQGFTLLFATLEEKYSVMEPCTSHNYVNACYQR